MPKFILLHPQMQALVDTMAAAPSFSDMTPVEARSVMGALEHLLGEGESIAHSAGLQIESGDGYIPCRLLSPGNPTGLIVYFHGGGWVLGTLAHVEAAARILANASGCAVLLVDYRLAPEYPYPAAINDSHAVLEWTADNMIALFGRALPIIVGGDSAGGNLAALAAAWAKDKDGPTITGQLLIYPITDCDFETDSYRQFATNPILSKSTMQWFWDHYLADISLRRTPEVSPLRRSDFRGLPQTIIVSAGHDPLLSEGLSYGNSLKKAGVPVTERHYPDMGHGFATMPALIDAATDALTFAGRKIAQWV